MGIIENKQKQNMMSNTYIVLALGIATMTSAIRLQSQDVFYLVEIGDWLDGAAIDIGDWTEGAFEDLGDWTEGAFVDFGDWIKETMMKLATEEGRNELKRPIFEPIIFKIAEFLVDNDVPPP